MAGRPEPMTENRGATLISDLRCVTPAISPPWEHVSLKAATSTNKTANSQQVLIVDDLLARTTWPGQSAIGKKVQAEHVTQRGPNPYPAWWLV